jgi:hypothetical protein
MVPEPVPFLLTESEREVALKVAVIVLSELIVVVQLPVPEHPPPDQPTNVLPLLATAVRVTEVPSV